MNLVRVVLNLRKKLDATINLRPIYLNKEYGTEDIWVEGKILVGTKEMGYLITEEI